MSSKFSWLNAEQQKGLKMQLNKLDLQNKLVLSINKRIEKFPHNKINEKLGGSQNQNIIFNFNNKNINTDRRLINNKKLLPNLVNTRFSLPNNIALEATNKTGGKNAIKLLRSNVSDLSAESGSVLVKNPSRLGIINNVIKILTSFFKGLSCLISRPQFINKTDKLIVRIFYYQNNSNKDALFSSNKSNFIYNLFNGTALAKAQYSAPKSQNFSAILRDMLGQTKWNKIAQKVLNNNENINSLELANIPKKVFILFIKDFINITSSNKRLSIENALILLQKGYSSIALVKRANELNTKSYYNNLKPSITVANSLRAEKGLVGIKKYNKLFIKLINSTNSEALIRKRTRLSKSFFNKSLLLKLATKVNNHNNKNLIDPSGTNSKNNNAILPTELIGKGLLLSPINKNKLDKLLGWSTNNIDLSEEYNTLSTALLTLLNNKKINNTHYGTEKLANKILKNLTSLSRQFANELNNKISFINTYFIVGINLKTAKPGNTKFTKLANSSILPTNGVNAFSVENAAKVINLINKNFDIISSLAVQSAAKVENLIITKEALKAYNYNIFNNQNSVDSSGLMGNSDNLKKFKLLSNLLAKIFKKDVELQLIKLHNVGLESEILSKVISLNAKYDKSSVLIKKIWRRVSISKASLIHFYKQNSILNGNDNAYDANVPNNVIIPVFSKSNNKKQIGIKHVNLIANSKNNIKLSQIHDHIDNVQVLNSNPLSLGKTVGLSIRIAGRLRADPIKPKQTVKTVIIGNFSKERVNTSNLSSFTSKNRKGTYRVTVKVGQIRTISTTALTNTRNLKTAV